jgi:uncharacterized protein
MSDNEIIKQIKSLESVIRGYGVDKLYLFGSAQRGDFTDESDVDVLVDFMPKQKNFSNFMGLYLDLEKTLARKIDLVTRTSLYHKMKPEVYATMQRLL